MMKRKRNKMTTATWIVFTAVVLCAIAIAAMRMGVVEGYDFGAGAYYYADIPEYEKIMNDDAYSTSVPVWLHMAIFLGWGFLMYRLWTWVDNSQ